jgi:GNAT superfamily N-acetyltransferase
MSIFIIIRIPSYGISSTRVCRTSTARKDRALLLCAIAESEIVGTGAIKRLDNRECEMVRMFVALAYRGRGIGWTIADELIRFARIAGYDRIRLSSNNSLMASHRSLRMVGLPTCFFSWDPGGGTYSRYYTLQISNPQE